MQAHHKKQKEAAQKSNKNIFMSALYAQQKSKEKESSVETDLNRNEEFHEAAEEQEAPEVGIESESEADSQFFFDCWEYEYDEPDPVFESDEDSEDDKSKKFMDDIIRAVQERLKYEENPDGADPRWLMYHLQENDWYIRQCHMNFVCKKLDKWWKVYSQKSNRAKHLQFNLKYTALPYYKDIYVWLPDRRWGQRGMPSCPTCKCNNSVGRAGWRNDVLGRRVVSLNTTYYIVSQRYECKACENKKSKGQQVDQYGFHGYNHESFQLYENGIQYNFPAILTKRSAIDKSLIDLMRPLFDKGLRPLSFQKTLVELHSKKYTKDRIKYNYRVRDEKLRRQKLQLPDADHSVCSDFNDPKGYCGFVPSAEYLSNIYISYHETIKDHLDLEGLCTGLNEYGECRIQFNTVTEDHQQMKPALEAFKTTAAIYGQPSVTLVTCDNPSHDKRFFTEIFDDLAPIEEELNSNITSSLDQTLPTCTVGNIPVSYQKGKVQLNTISETIHSHIINGAYSRDNPFVIGFDIETKVLQKFGRIRGKGRTATIQMAYRLQYKGEMECNVIQLKNSWHMSSLPQKFIQLMKDDRVLLVGVGVTSDLKKLRKDFPMDCFDPNKNEVHAINLGLYARKRGMASTGSIGMQQLVKDCFGEYLSKDPSIRFSDWDKETLTKEQVDYAALDAIKGLQLYDLLKQKVDLSKRLTQQEAQQGMKVDIVPAHGSVMCMMSRAAIGEILHDTSCVVPILDCDTDRLEATSNTRIVRITKVCAPSLIIPNIKKSNGENVTLGDYQQHYGLEEPFVTRVSVKMLTAHAAARQRLQFTNTRTQTQPASTYPVSMNATIPHPRFDTDDDAENDVTDNLDGLDNSNNDESVTHIDELDVEAERLASKLNGNEIQFLINVIQKGELGASNSSIHKCDELGDPPEKIVNRFSTVLGDPFHIMDRPKVPSRHCYKKLYKIAFRDALLAWNTELLQELKDVMIEKDAMAAQDVDRLLYFNSKIFRDCVDRKILPPEQLYWRLRAVFMTFGNLIDPRTNKPLFNKAAWGKAKNILDEVLAGLISDPPGVSFYMKRLNDDGTEMKNKYGLNMLES
ncbi:hypothetical protein CTEN210_05657, partial [Chaetoceros tenuissimus]